MLFPTLYSTLDPAAIGAFVSRQYGLGECTSRLILCGVGDTYLILAERKKFVMRVYRNSHRTLDHIHAEVQLLCALHQANVSVSYPIPDQLGCCVQFLEAAEGTRHAVLFSFAAGESLTHFSDVQLRSLGEEMAKFHDISSTIQLRAERWVYDVNSTMVAPLHAVRHYFASLPDELTWWLHATQEARAMLESVSGNQFDIGYCHFDFLPKNFHFDGDRITLFDFDFFGRGWLVNDLASFWTHLSLDVQFNRMSVASADRSFDVFLEAYQGVRPVSRSELSAIPSLSLGWWCFYMGFHATHDLFNALVQPAHLKMRTALIRQLTEKNAHRRISGS